MSENKDGCRIVRDCQAVASERNPQLYILHSYGVQCKHSFQVIKVEVL